MSPVFPPRVYYTQVWMQYFRTKWYYEARTNWYSVIRRKAVNESTFTGDASR